MCKHDRPVNFLFEVTKVDETLLALALNDLADRIRSLVNAEPGEVLKLAMEVELAGYNLDEGFPQVCCDYLQGDMRLCS